MLREQWTYVSCPIIPGSVSPDILSNYPPGISTGVWRGDNTGYGGWQHGVWRGDNTAYDEVTTRGMTGWQHGVWRGDNTAYDGVTTRAMTGWQHSVWRGDNTAYDEVTTRGMTGWQHGVWRDDNTGYGGVTTRGMTGWQHGVWRDDNTGYGRWQHGVWRGDNTGYGGMTTLGMAGDNTAYDGVTTQRMTRWQHGVWRGDNTGYDGVTTQRMTGWQHGVWRGDNTGYGGVTTRGMTGWQHSVWRGDNTAYDEVTTRSMAGWQHWVWPGDNTKYGRVTTRGSEAEGRRRTAVQVAGGHSTHRHAANVCVNGCRLKWFVHCRPRRKLLSTPLPATTLTGGRRRGQANSLCPACLNLSMTEHRRHVIASLMDICIGYRVRRTAVYKPHLAYPLLVSRSEMQQCICSSQSCFWIPFRVYHVVNPSDCSRFKLSFSSFSLSDLLSASSATSILGSCFFYRKHVQSIFIFCTFHNKRLFSRIIAEM